MIDTDKYEGHTEGKWIMGEHKGRPSISAVEDAETPTWVKSIARGLNPSQTADHALLLDAPLLLAEVKRLREELDKQMEYIEWLEEFAPKAGEYNLPWDAYELAKGIHWTQMEKEE